MTNEEIKEKIELLKELLEYGLEYKDYIQVVNAFEDIKNLIKKQDKIIDLMAEYIEYESNVYYKDKNEVIDIFRKKVENDN